MGNRNNFENIPIVNTPDKINEINLTEAGLYRINEKIPLGELTS